MKSIILNGVEVSVGSMVRFMDNTELYTSGVVSESVILPELYGYYVVRGFITKLSNQWGASILLEGINNKVYELNCHNGSTIVCEPPFSPRRFIPVPNPKMSQSDIIKESKANGIKVKITKEVLEALDVKLVSYNYN